MFKRKDLSASEQATAVVDQGIIPGCKHIHIQFCQIDLSQFLHPGPGLVKDQAFTGRYRISLGTLAVLSFHNQGGWQGRSLRGHPSAWCEAEVLHNYGRSYHKK